MAPEETPLPLPSASLVPLAKNVSLLAPLSRRGHGPGLIIIISGNLQLQNTEKILDPPPHQKWAEEGYVVVLVSTGSVEGSSIQESLKLGVEALSTHSQCDEKEKFGLILYDPESASEVSLALDTISTQIHAVSYGAQINSKNPLLLHMPGSTDLSTVPDTTLYKYPEAQGLLFIVPGHAHYNHSAANVAHTRTLTFLRKSLGGPDFDLEKIWEEHTYFEFENRSVAKTMSTMVQEPYVNNIPTMTGGIGRELLTDFYRDHFIWANPPDAKMELVSRTVSVDRVIDEFIYSFTHDRAIGWMLPGIPPTGKHVRVAVTSVVNVRGDRLYHEHIAWCQATVLVQLGLLPEYLPYPYPLPDGSVPAPGKRFEYRLPVAGAEAADKLMNESAVVSNGMLAFKVREVDI